MEKAINNQRAQQNKSRSLNSGFTIIEVIIALAIFAAFATAFLTGQSYNVADSVILKKELFLRELSHNIINEVIIDPPNLESSLTLTPTKKSFEDFPNYEYIIEYKKFEIPEISKLKGSSEDEDEEQTQMQKQIETQLKENLEKLIWQLQVTVRDKTTDESYSIATWLLDSEEEVQFSGL